MLSLMRSARLISYGFMGGYEPGVGSDTGLGLGKTYKLNYAVIPHAGDWRSDQPWRAGLEFNNPLIVRTVAPHPGDLPAKWGLVEVSGADVVVSALKPSNAGGAVLRVYEAAGRPSPGVRANWNVDIGAVHEANLIEDAGPGVAARRRSFEFDLKPYEIKTFRVQAEAHTPGAAAPARH
jgi:alpha-mannosidase